MRSRSAPLLDHLDEEFVWLTDFCVAHVATECLDRVWNALLGTIASVALDDAARLERAHYINLLTLYRDLRAFFAQDGDGLQTHQLDGCANAAPTQRLGQFWEPRAIQNRSFKMKSIWKHSIKLKRWTMNHSRL